MNKLWFVNGLFGLVALSACSPEPEIVVPEELVGTWTTHAPRYAERGFEIWTDAVVFYTGTRMEDFTVHGIRDIRSEPAGDRTLYTLEYRSREGAIATFAFDYDPEDGMVRFKNQQLVEWIRNPETSQVD